MDRYSDNIDTQHILSAYVERYGSRPQRASDLLAFSKTESRSLRYSEARKIMALSQSRGRSSSNVTSHNTTTNNNTITHKPQRASSNKNVSRSRLKRNNLKESKSSPSSNRSKSVTKSQRKKSRKKKSTKKRRHRLLQSATNEATINISPRASKSPSSKARARSKGNRDRCHSESGHHLDLRNEYMIGDQVKLSRDREGIIRFIGSVDFASGIMVGIELLHGAAGKHDGKMGDKRYFKTPPNRGIFVRKKRIHRKVRRRERKSSLQLSREASLESIRSRTPTASPQHSHSGSDSDDDHEDDDVPNDGAPPLLHRPRSTGNRVEIDGQSPRLRGHGMEEKKGRSPRSRRPHDYHRSSLSPRYISPSSSMSIRSPRDRVSPKLHHHHHRPLRQSPFGVVDGNSNNIDSSSIMVYRKASLNLHRHILQRVHDLKYNEYTEDPNDHGIGTGGSGGSAINGISASFPRSSSPNNRYIDYNSNHHRLSSSHSLSDRAFPFHSKLHSPMIPIRIDPILTFDNVSAQTMQRTTSKMMSKNKTKTPRKVPRRSLIVHQRPSNSKMKPIPAMIAVSSASSTESVGGNRNSEYFRFSEEDENILDAVAMRDRESLNEHRARKQSISFSAAPFSPSMGSVPPLSQVTIDYVEMEDRVNRLVEKLMTTKERIEDKESVYSECEITENDLTEGLPSWIDLLCTHSDLFSDTALIKEVTTDNAFWSPSECAEDITNDTNNNNGDGDGGNDSDSDDDEDDDTFNGNTNGTDNGLYSEDTTYFYSVFERLLFELDLHFLYFIYDIGIEAESAFNEQHPSSLFILSGNIVQILKKCSPVLTADIATFYAHILAPYSLQIRYQYLNDTAKWRTVPMVKYSTDGIQNDYNFVGRVQFEEMFDRIQSTLIPIDHSNNNGEEEEEEEDVDPDDLGVDDDDDLMATIPTKYDSDLTFEVMVHRDGDGDDGLELDDKAQGLVIYKSVIPGIFTVSSALRVTNLKRTMSIPSMVLKAPCHFECEKWNEEGDYYGFIRLKLDHDLVINGRSTISASESGYCNGNGLGLGHFKNERSSKTKFSSGGGYGTASVSPHPECPEGAMYGEDCLECNCLYYGSPCNDATERGGGIIDILCGRKFVNFGTVECNGSSGLHFGGSSGGSIRVVADHVANYGTITARGGKGALYQRPGSKRKQLGTDGGDGRIFIICRRFINSGDIGPEPTIVITADTSNYAFSQIKSLDNNITF